MIGIFGDLNPHQSFSYIAGDGSDANGYTLPPKYREKKRIKFVEIRILEVNTGVH